MDRKGMNEWSQNSDALLFLGDHRQVHSLAFSSWNGPFLEQQPYRKKSVQELSSVLTNLTYINKVLPLIVRLTSCFIVAAPDDAHVESLIRDYDRRKQSGWDSMLIWRNFAGLLFHTDLIHYRLGLGFIYWEIYRTFEWASFGPMRIMAKVALCCVSLSNKVDEIPCQFEWIYMNVPVDAVEEYHEDNPNRCWVRST